MITQKITDKYEIINNDAVILYHYNSNLILHFEFEKFSFDLELKFETVSDETNKIVKNIEKDKIIINCINFNELLGTGTVNPLEIATVENKKLYFHFWTYVLGEPKNEKIARKIEYTVLKEI